MNISKLQNYGQGLLHATNLLKNTVGSPLSSVKSTKCLFARTSLCHYHTARTKPCKYTTNHYVLNISSLTGNIKSLVPTHTQTSACLHSGLNNAIACGIQNRSYSSVSYPITPPDHVQHSRSNPIHKEGSFLTTKRIVRRKKTKDGPPRDQEIFDVLAFATADRYNLKSLTKNLIAQGLYEYIQLPHDMRDDAIHCNAIYGIEDEPRGMFFFRDGSVVFWNMPDVERKSVLKFLRQHQEGSYDPDLVKEEFEHIEYIYTMGSTKLQDDEIYLSHPLESTDISQHQLEKYAFSNAIASSVKLAIWEATLDQYVESIEYVLQDLKDGKKIKLSETDVLRKAGWLLHLRHLINLRSDLLDPPDAYWDREPLENLYNKTCSHLDIARRTRVMNEKLNHCCELTNMLLEILKDRHHTRLEWMIIILILIEVVFEIFHTYERRHGNSET